MSLLRWSSVYAFSAESAGEARIICFPASPLNFNPSSNRAEGKWPPSTSSKGFASGILRTSGWGYGIGGIASGEVGTCGKLLLAAGLIKVKMPTSAIAPTIRTTNTIAINSHHIEPCEAIAGVGKTVGLSVFTVFATVAGVLLDDGVVLADGLGFGEGVGVGVREGVGLGVGRLAFAAVFAFAFTGAFAGGRFATGRVFAFAPGRTPGIVVFAGGRVGRGVGVGRTGRFAIGPVGRAVGGRRFAGTPAGFACEYVGGAKVNIKVSAKQTLSAA